MQVLQFSLLRDFGNKPFTSLYPLFYVRTGAGLFDAFVRRQRFKQAFSLSQKLCLFLHKQYLNSETVSRVRTLAAPNCALL